MPAEPVWFLREFTWLGSGFIHAVADDYADTFAADLRGLRFTVAMFPGGSVQEFREHLGAALGFPDFVRNWDALHDFFRDFAKHDRFAVMWRKADAFARADPKLFGEACRTLVDELDALPFQAVLVITGSGDAFHRPSPASAS
jgi:hypothetical protein